MNVDISQVERTVTVSQSGQRVPFKPDLSRAVPMTIHSLSVPVEAKGELLAYKRITQRPEDLADIGAITGKKHRELSQARR